MDLYFLYKGKPLKNAAIELYLGHPVSSNDLAYITAVSNSTGLAVLRDLTIASYYVRVRLQGQSHADFSFEVPIPIEKRELKDGVELRIVPIPQTETEVVQAQSPIYPPVPFPRKESKPLSAQVQAFQGVIIDPSGAVIPNVEIEVRPINARPGEIASLLKSSRAGTFSINLKEGKYVAEFRSPGFVQQRIYVSIEPHGWSGLQLSLGITDTCGGIAPGNESKIADWTRPQLNWEQ